MLLVIDISLRVADHRGIVSRHCAWHAMYFNRVRGISLGCQHATYIYHIPRKHAHTLTNAEHRKGVHCSHSSCAGTARHLASLLECICSAPHVLLIAVSSHLTLLGDGSFKTRRSLAIIQRFVVSRILERAELTRRRLEAATRVQRAWKHRVARDGVRQVVMASAAIEVRS